MEKCVSRPYLRRRAGGGRSPEPSPLGYDVSGLATAFASLPQATHSDTRSQRARRLVPLSRPPVAAAVFAMPTHFRASSRFISCRW